ncbi:MAG: ABC transporter permease [Micromonosporaceae bacterium]
MSTVSEDTRPARGTTPPPPRNGNSSRRFDHNSKVAVGVGIVVVGAVTLGLWELAAVRGLIDPTFSGQPTGIAASLVDGVRGDLLTVDAVYTTLATVLGFLGASVLGIFAAFALAQMPYARKVLSPYLTALNSLPRIALAPLFVIWFGIGLLSHVVMAASLTFFVVFANTMAGIESVDRDHLLLARLQGASRAQTFVRFVIPSALPSMFVGLELGFIFGMLGTVAGEMIAGEHGLGVRLQKDAGVFATDSYFATLILLVVITSLISQVFQLVKRRLLRWQTVHLVSSTE